MEKRNQDRATQILFQKCGNRYWKLLLYHFTTNFTFSCGHLINLHNEVHLHSCLCTYGW